MPVCYVVCASSFLAFLAAGIGGALAGIGVSIIQFKGRINSLLAGILALFMLYSINFNVMGKPNISLFNGDIWK